jgi:hypothetical protein
MIEIIFDQYVAPSNLNSYKSFYFDSSKYYIIKKSDFRIHVRKDSTVDNILKIYSYSQPGNFDHSTLSTVITASLKNPKLPRYSVSYYYNSLDILTYYYTQDDVIRFFFKNNKTKNIPEENYFECSVQDFIDFFDPIIE